MLVLLAAILAGWAAAPGAAAPPAQIAPTAGPIYTIEVTSTLTTATISYMRRSLRVAEAAHAQALIIMLSSSGGILSELRPLAADLYAAAVPVVVYIAPSGTQSSAPGAFLLSAAHLSAMAPETSFGSAYPLASVDPALTQQSSALVSDSIADQLRDWNRARGRSAAWVDQAIQSGAILTSQQAAATTPPTIDIVAADQAQLQALLDGRVVTLADQSEVAIATLGQPTIAITPTLAELVWQLLAEPNVAFALLILGALAISLEVAAPGTSLFAGIGIVMLIGAAVGLVALPVQWWAIALLLGGLALLGLEFVVSSHGGLTVAGLGLLAAGGLNLIDPVQAPGASVTPWAVATIVIGLAAVVGLGFGLALRARRAPLATGSESLIGRTAEVRQRLEPHGMVFVDGALWQAISEEGAVEVGDWVRIVAIHRLRLLVRPIEGTQPV